MLSFIYNNINNLDKKMYIVNSNHESGFDKDLEFVKVPGRLGDLIIDNKTYSNRDIVIEFKCKANKPINLFREELELWLQSDSNYKKLEFSDGIIVEAVCYKKIDINKISDGFYSVTVNFNAKKVV